jgi:polyferredoxin
MAKNALPPGLIRYTTTRALGQHLDGGQVVRHVFRPRVLVYSAILLAVVSAIAVSIALRVPLKVDVIRDRGVLAREVEHDEVEDVYRMQVMNTTERRQTYMIDAHGIEGLRVASEPRFEVEPASSRTVVLRLEAPRDSIPPGSNRVTVHVHALDDPSIDVVERTVFFGMRH